MSWTKNIVVLGSTGSIGENTLRIVEKLPDRFRVVGLAADRNVDRLLEQAAAFDVPVVALSDGAAAKRGAEQAPAGLRVLEGVDGVSELAAMDAVDVVVAAIVGMAGLRPTLAALQHGTDVALATKEVLVSAGHIVTRACAEHGAKLIPVDSEPSAIYQCLAGASARMVRRLVLTASGGPFSHRVDVDLDKVTVAEALNHPNWDMGRKVTIDSATLMNKGLETIECSWLFDIPIEQVEVIIHPESIVHSMVEFLDGSTLAQLSAPDMRFAIQCALTYPDRLDSELPGLNMSELGALHFNEPDVDRFPCLQLARLAANAGGSMPAVMNAANEVAVELFLSERIPFSGIWKLVETVIEQHELVAGPDLEQILETDAWARRTARNI